MSGSPRSPHDSEAAGGRRLALVVAVAQYADQALRGLRSPVRDATVLRDLLADPAVGGFTVTSVIDETAQQIRLSMEEFLSDRHPDDLLLVYLSCHGLVDLRRRLYFAARDTLKDRLAASAVEAHWLLDQLEDCRARRQVLILDCCFSGAFAHGTKGDDDLALGERLLGQGRGRVVLTASRATEYSFEGEPRGDAADEASVFTRALVTGISSGRADTDRDGYISVDDAYAYAFEHVRRSGAQQTPQRWLYGAEGNIVLARTPAVQGSSGPAATAPDAAPDAVPDAVPDAAPDTVPDAVPDTGAGAGGRRWRRAGVLALSGLGIVVVTLGAALVLRELYGGPSDPSGAPADGLTSSRGQTITTDAPWRLRINAEDGPSDGCVVELTNTVGGGPTTWRDVYGEKSFQVSTSGTFRWATPHPGCLVTYDEGAGRRDLPFAQEVATGDTDAFVPGDGVSVTVRDFNDSGPCQLRLHAASDGRLLDFRTVEEGTGPAALSPHGEELVYLSDLQCGVLVAAGR